MKQLPYHNRPRSLAAQIARMKRWPDFTIQRRLGSAIMWQGPLRGFQRFYTVGILWGVADLDRPYVYLIDPPLTPRPGAAYEDIPHLMLDRDDPSQSGLCLFDPDGAEWSDHMLIADTTIPWAAKWLYYYELWHYDGVWRGGGVGPESVGEARRKAIHAEASEHTADA